MVYASFGQPHGNCIVSYASSRSCMGSLILMLHHQCNQTFQQCIAFMVIYQALHSELEHLIIVPWLHWYKWTRFTIYIIQNNQTINSEQECLKHHVSTSHVNPHLLYMSFVMNVTDIYHPHDCDLNSIKTWSPFSLLSCHTPMIFTINISFLRYDCFLLLLMGDLLLFYSESFVRISGRDSF
jgi:hypothetical protein